MAVYTPLSLEDIHALIAEFSLGSLVSYKEIAEGVENSNFLLITGDHCKHILTVYEKRMNVDELPFFLHLMKHLAARNIPCPLPLITRSGLDHTYIQGKAVAIVTFLNGASTEAPTLSKLYDLGVKTAMLHEATADFSMHRVNDLSLKGWRTLINKIQGETSALHPDLGQIMEDEWRYLDAHWPDALPSGVIHADLFQDNVFFIDETLSGFIDFYFACNDMYAYELAIIINAWCFDEQKKYNPAKVRALLQGYQSVRMLSKDEHASLPILLRGSALRFLLTRAHDWIYHDTTALVTAKDPMEYLHKLQWHQQHPFAIEESLAA